MLRGASFSDCRTYRYELWREWDPTLGAFVVIGLNPSTADERTDDPTIRRCIGFAQRFGCGRLVMLNLFAFRATKPKDMLATVDPIGPRNDEILRHHAADTGSLFTVAAWGIHGEPTRVAEVAAIFPRLECLGRNKDGSPKHPLYLPATAPLIPFRGNARPLLSERAP